MMVIEVPTDNGAEAWRALESGLAEKEIPIS